VFECNVRHNIVHCCRHTGVMGLSAFPNTANFMQVLLSICNHVQVSISHYNDLQVSATITK
jgi:hypothetical protein